MIVFYSSGYCTYANFPSPFFRRLFPLLPLMSLVRNALVKLCIYSHIRNL